MTRYVILWEKHEASAELGLWEVVASVDAPTAEQAIRGVHPVDGNRYVAVPERSWQPLKAQVQTVTRLAPETVPGVSGDDRGGEEAA